jgi:hypothetical protein
MIYNLAEEGFCRCHAAGLDLGDIHHCVVVVGILRLVVRGGIEIHLLNMNCRPIVPDAHHAFVVVGMVNRGVPLLILMVTPGNKAGQRM